MRESSKLLTAYNKEVDKLLTESLIASGEVPAVLFVVASPVSIFESTSVTGTNNKMGVLCKYITKPFLSDKEEITLKSIATW